MRVNTAISLAVVCLLVLSNRSVMAQDGEDPAAPPQEDVLTLTLQSAQNFAEARLRLQYTYATSAGRELVNFLHAYRIVRNEPAPINEFQGFAVRMLSNDPFLEFSNYLPEQRLTLTFRNNLALAEGLRGGELVYVFENGRWRLQENNRIALPETAAVVSTSAPDGLDSDVSPSSPDGFTTLKPLDPSLLYLDTYYCMGVITNYCLNPVGYATSETMLTDGEWCPAWHQAVQSP